MRHKLILGRNRGVRRNHSDEPLNLRRMCRGCVPLKAFGQWHPPEKAIVIVKRRKENQDEQPHEQREIYQASGLPDSRRRRRWLRLSGEITILSGGPDAS